MDYGTFELLRDTTVNDVTKILEGRFDERTYKYFALLTEKHYSIFDYCGDFTKICVDKPTLDSANELLQEESINYLNELHEKGKIISHLGMFIDLHRLINSEVVTQPR